MHLDWRMQGLAGWPVYTSLTETEARELGRLAHRKRVLEIGSAYGFSAVTMAFGGARHITAVDPHTWCQPEGTLGEMRANLESYGVTDRVRILEMTFFNAARIVRRECAPFDLIFIDGDHAYATVKFDAENALELLAQGGTIACHDYAEDCCCPDVRRALDEVFPAGPTRVIDTLAVYEGLK